MADALKGILPAVASPRDENDTFLEEKFAALAQSLYEQGGHGLYVCGATGDGYDMLTADCTSSDLFGQVGAINKVYFDF